MNTLTHRQMKSTIRIFIVTILALTCSSVTSSAQQYKDIFDYIRGKVPGVQVGQSGPGQMPTIIIRGIGTNSDQYQPLFIVDGVQTDNISTIDPNNVYSIDIIKDGTASIYGMQGANGVIMVTTKSAMMAAEQEAAAKKAAKAAARAARAARAAAQRNE